MKRATIAAALTAGAALLAAPLAVAAPTGDSANESIVRLHDEGNRVVFDEAAASTACTVTTLQPMQVSELPRVGPPIAPLSPPVHVGVLC